MLNLQYAEVFDIECVPNVFTFSMEMLNYDTKATWEISEFRDDSQSLLEHFRYLAFHKIPLIGFNNIGYDYPVIHELWLRPYSTYKDLHRKSKSIIESEDRFGHTVWASDRFCPQIDLYKLHHFDNRAKSTSLKGLQINMRSPNVMESSLPFDRDLTEQEITQELIPYNIHDVSETKRFAQFSKSAMDFRVGLIEQFNIDVLNWNDTKIGEEMIVQRLGDSVCYDRSSGRKQPRRSVRGIVDLNEIILPYIKFEHSEFNRVLAYIRSQMLKADEFKEDEQLETKGVFAGLSANVNGFQFYYGQGGIHGSVHRQMIVSSSVRMIRDIDVASLYPSIAIVNELHPEHLGQKFVGVYSQLPLERKRWQQEKGKKCAEANALKLASNGAYGKSNSKFSPLYDPKFTMSITINGQFLLSMLAEKLLKVPTVQLIQINTDGITYSIDRQYLQVAEAYEKQWEVETKLVLEATEYSRMWIRDVNNYIAESMDGTLKLKGTYWYPDPDNYHDSISNSQPVSWYKRFDAVISTMAAVEHMTKGVDIEQYIKSCFNPYAFCCAVKVNRSDMLMWGDVKEQRNTRFYISTDGKPLVKLAPPTQQAGTFKKSPKVSDADYKRVMLETGGAWDARVCTKNKTMHGERETRIVAGYNVEVVNDISKFNWSTVNYDWYIKEAQKLVI